MLLEVAVVGKPNQDRQHGRGWQREQDAEETEQLSAGRDRKDHEDRMQPDAIADQFGRQDGSLDELCDRERGDDADLSAVGRRRSRAHPRRRPARSCARS